MNVYQRFLEVQAEIAKAQEEKLELERQITPNTWMKLSELELEPLPL